MNDKERADWVNNDEGLYNWWRKSRLSMSSFVKANRKELDDLINPIVTGEKRSHYLIYG